jgi:hypothetical protein
MAKYLRNKNTYIIFLSILVIVCVAYLLWQNGTFREGLEKSSEPVLYLKEMADRQANLPAILSGNASPEMSSKITELVADYMTFLHAEQAFVTEVNNNRQYIDLGETSRDVGNSPEMQKQVKNIRYLMLQLYLTATRGRFLEQTKYRWDLDMTVDHLMKGNTILLKSAQTIITPGVSSSDNDPFLTAFVTLLNLYIAVVNANKLLRSRYDVFLIPDYQTKENGVWGASIGDKHGLVYAYFRNVNRPDYKYNNDFNRLIALMDKIRLAHVHTYEPI